MDVRFDILGCVDGGGCEKWEMGIACNALRMHGGRMGYGSRYEYIFERGVVGYRYDMIDEI
jgi:hypothetical protein